MGERIKISKFIKDKKYKIVGDERERVFWHSFSEGEIVTYTGIERHNCAYKKIYKFSGKSGASWLIEEMVSPIKNKIRRIK